MNSYPNPAIVLVDDEPAMLGMLHGLVRDLAPWLRRGCRLGRRHRFVSMLWSHPARW